MLHGYVGLLLASGASCRDIGSRLLYDNEVQWLRDVCPKNMNFIYIYMYISHRIHVWNIYLHLVDF